jgi:glutamate N-acetyltransferase / amino-acid N-acetyltransferase
MSTTEISQMELPQGFSFSSVAAGIKASGRPDLALVECSPGTKAAAVFTKNRVVAAPVQVGRAALKASGGSIRAVVVNSGNANCATGSAGLKACYRICGAAARLLGIAPEAVFPSSTGIIGVQLPAEKIVAALPALIVGRQSTQEKACQFARTILTTDTRPKVAWRKAGSGSRECNVLGIAKGSGMIHPKLATMLVYLFTDAKASPGKLKSALREVCDQTFNNISVDGDTSTNDTVLLMASGKGKLDLSRGGNTSFRKALLQVCESLAQQIIADGEGVQHVVCLTIEGTRNRPEALHIARAIAHSPLVKTAWAGADPNWGRILAACGNSGVPIDPSKIDIFIGEQRVCSKGESWPFDEFTAHQHLSQRECDVRVCFHRGSTRLRFYTTDLSVQYVRINADYST